VIRLSVVIPSRNGRDILEKYLPGIVRETFHCNGELLVVDDCSTDGTKEYLSVEHPRIKVIERTGEPAFCRAVNLGMNKASGSYLLLLNNDTVPEPGSFSALVERLHSEDESTAVAIPSIPRPDGTDDSLSEWEWKGAQGAYWDRLTGWRIKKQPSIGKHLDRLHKG
jgi:GT2 family glycosyltransferase